MRFRFLGWREGWYVLRLMTADISAKVTHKLRGEIFHWLLEQDINLNEDAYLSNGNTGDGPVVPSLPDGSALCLLFKRAVDVLRFEQRFPCQGLTPASWWAATHAEASVHRFVLGDIVQIAYAAMRQMDVNFGDDIPDWGELTDDEQQFLRQVISEYLDHADWSAEQQHESWLDRRRLEGWTYDPVANLAVKKHPHMVPWNKLPPREQAKARLTASAVRDLAPMLPRRG